MSYVQKGDWIQASWLRTTNASLAGAQMKVGAERIGVAGVVRHVRGDHPTTPASLRLYVDAEPGHGLPLEHIGCACGPHVGVNPDHVVAHRPKESSVRLHDRTSARQKAKS